MLKAVLPYDAPPSIRTIIAAADRSVLEIVRLDEADREGLAREFVTADVLLHDTRALLNAERIGRMKAGAIVVNAARGALVDEAALADALARRHIAAAGLDVMADEPPRPGNPLLASPHVVATPHIAWLTDGTWRRSIAVIVENCRRLAAGEPLLHRVV